MMPRIETHRRVSALAMILLAAPCVLAWRQATAQLLQPPSVAAPVRTPHAAAMIDLTGYWVSVVTEDWSYRMLTAAKGDAGSLPVNAAARKAAAAWDRAADKAAGESCRSFGAAGIIRRPGRLHISWQNEQTLRIDFSAGEQTRLLSFDAASAAPGAQHTWQGQSLAQWVRVRNWAQFSPPSEAPVGGTLKVVTTNLRAGYLQSNGFPYSDSAKMTEYFDRIDYEGTPWLIVTTVIEDPRYLTDAVYWSTHFKYESDASKWKPHACDAF
jgi:hypothetical protein